MSDQLSSYLCVSTALFSLGLAGLLSRRNVVAMLISLELILSAANINFVALGRFVLPDKGTGQVIALFVIALAAAEVCIALSIALLLTRRYGSVHIDDAKDLRD
jgi:NADH:ubiquinone oxidoreductase subunit K